MDSEHYSNEPVKVVVSPWPSRTPQVVAFCFLCSVGAFLGYIYMVKANPEAIRALTSAFGIYMAPKDQAAEKQSNLYQVAFWTPSIETKEDLTKEFEGKVMPQEYQWRLIDDKDAQLKFGLYLKNSVKEVEGYRHYLVEGHGKTVRLRGHWWVVTLQKSISPESFIGHYRSFWKPQTQVYLETHGAPAGYFTP